MIKETFVHQLLCTTDNVIGVGKCGYEPTGVLKPKLKDGHQTAKRWGSFALVNALNTRASELSSPTVALTAPQQAKSYESTQGIIREKAISSASRSNEKTTLRVPSFHKPSFRSQSTLPQS